MCNKNINLYFFQMNSHQPICDTLGYFPVQFVNFNRCNQICKLKTSTSAVTYPRFYLSAFRKANLASYTVVTRLGLVLTTEAAKQILMNLTSLFHRYVYNVLEQTENNKPVLYYQSSWFEFENFSVQSKEIRVFACREL